MRQPDFFVVGAAKSGTTALWKYFQQHPEIFVTKNLGQKELGYFSNQYGISNKDNYLKFFKDALPSEKIGEVCHAYLSSKESAQWIKNEVPDAKIIIILRNPIERAHSLYNWMIMHGYENECSFEKALKREEDILKGRCDSDGLLHGYKNNYLYYSSGLYADQVKRYLKIFGKENVFILEYDDFQQNQVKKLNEIFIFLNLSTVTSLKLKKVNKSRRVVSIKLQYFSRRMLLRVLKENSVLHKFFNTIMKINMHSKEPRPIRKKTRLDLMKKYRENVNSLSVLCNQNFNEKWLHIK